MRAFGRTPFALVLLILSGCAIGGGLASSDVPSSAPIGDGGAAESAPGSASHAGENDAAVLDGGGDLGTNAGTDAASPASVCAAGMTQLGEYATWWGKVNVQRPSGGAWSVDSDCSSGADHTTIAYCQRLWPATTVQVALSAVTPETKPFTSGGGAAPGCGGLALSAGQHQFVCCAP
jgi:hypothetical protein